MVSVDVKHHVYLLTTADWVLLFWPLRGNSDRLTWVRHSSCKSSTTHSYQCVQYIHASKQWYGCQCLVFLTCAQVSMHAISHGSCTVQSPSPLDHWCPMEGQQYTQNILLTTLTLYLHNCPQHLTYHDMGTGCAPSSHPTWTYLCVETW